MWWIYVIVVLVVLFLLRHIMFPKYPTINDISTITDAKNPLNFEVLLHSGLKKNYSAKVAEIQKKHYPNITPFEYPIPDGSTLEDFFQFAVRVAKSQGWEIITVNNEKRIIQAVAVTKLLRFKDDVIIRVDQGDNRAVVQMRSKSRVGRGDIGANAKRIQKYFNSLQSTTFTKKD